MARLFLDANVLFSAAYRSETGLLKLWKLREVVLCSSRYALEEARINLNHEVQRTRLARLAGKVQLFDAGKHELPEGVSLPEKDVPIPQWSGQKRPMVVRSKPANGCGPGRDSFSPFSPGPASPFSCASSLARISGCDRGVAGGRAWR